MVFDRDLGVDPEEPKQLADELKVLMQRWVDQGASLNSILYTLSTALTGLLAQCGTPRAKVERLRNDLLFWMNSTDTMKEATGRLNRHERRALKASKPH